MSLLCLVVDISTARSASALRTRRMQYAEASFSQNLDLGAVLFINFYFSVMYVFVFVFPVICVEVYFTKLK
jgi:hypothetical protein